MSIFGHSSLQMIHLSYNLDKDTKYMSRKESIKKHLTMGFYWWWWVDFFFFVKLKDKILIHKGMVFSYLRVYGREKGNELVITCSISRNHRTAQVATKMYSRSTLSESFILPFCFVFFVFVFF